MELSGLKGIGPKREETLHAMGIYSLRDLLYMQPVSYQDRVTLFPCAVKQAGPVMVSGTIADAPRMNRFNGLTRVSCTITDETGKMPVTWYNQPWMMQQISAGNDITVYGNLTVKNGRRMLMSPQIVNEKGYIPVYRTVRGFPAASFRELIRKALEYIDECCPETLPYSVRMEYHLCELNFALRQVHFPESYEHLKTARRRLSFENFLLYQAALHNLAKDYENAYEYVFDDSLLQGYWNILPYKPTNAQSRVLKDIADDLRRKRSMSRLVQGDVGSGKTAVAFGAIYLSACSGYQSAMMAPTEILARQHYESACKLLEKEGIVCRLLTGSTASSERKKVLSELESGKCQAVFGTHALIGDKVHYHHLGLVITDEQHRFGVKQRTKLQTKGADSGLYPHVLVMSATPIPRTMALILYGDLDISVIDELPPGRKPVKTRLVPFGKREALYQYLRDTVKGGRQAYIVCPMVQSDDETEDNGLRNIRNTFDELKNGILRDVSMGITWGDQPAAEKEDVLRRFSDGSVSVLVSTTVIEVGINVPNATIMVIENAERFGLSQLHQLRGRVGRGNDESWCFMIAEKNDKLDVMCRTNDGFEIASKDLELRGPGDMLGVRQSGDPLIMLGGSFDARLLEQAVQCMKTVSGSPERQEDLIMIRKSAYERFENMIGKIALN